MRFAIGSDHAGFQLKEKVKAELTAGGHQVEDVGAFSEESTSYADKAAAVAKAVQEGRAERGVLVCGSGVGMSMGANRFRGVRAVLAPSPEHARLGRLHNDANVLCLGQRLTKESDAMAALNNFLGTEFEGGRHAPRVAQLDSLLGDPR